MTIQIVSHLRVIIPSKDPRYVLRDNQPIKTYDWGEAFAQTVLGG